MAEVGEIVRCAIIYVSPGASEQQNVLHWMVAGAPIDDSDLLDGIENYVRTEWGAAWAPTAADSSVIAAIDCQVLNANGTVKRDLGLASINVAGTGVGGVLAAATSAYFIAPTFTPKVRGSKYIPGMSEGALADGVWQSVSKTALLVLAGVWLAGVDLDGVPYLIAGVLSKKLAGFVALGDSVGVSSTPAYQRRRKPNVGS